MTDSDVERLLEKLDRLANPSEHEPLYGKHLRAAIAESATALRHQRTENAALRAELARAKVDGERLDWLEEVAPIADNAWEFDALTGTLVQTPVKGHCLTRHQYFKARQAIDAARASGRDKGE